MPLIDDLRDALGDEAVLSGKDAEGYASDWTRTYTGAPRVVVRPADTGQVSAAVRLAARYELPVVPVGGNTGLCGGTHGPDAMMISLERMNRIREIRPEARIAIVESGVVLASLHEAAANEGLAFPLTFGARGSAQIGGALSTNAGGSNVLRYGSTRGLCLGLEVVLPSGEVLNLMSELHKDNTGYDLKDLFIGAEGTLGLITAAVLRLVPQPQAHATAMVALPSLDDALTLLNRLQQATGNAVEAFEYMPRAYMDALLAQFPSMRPPFPDSHAVNIMVEVGANRPREGEPGADGTVPVVALLEEILASEMEAGRVLDATVARTEAQRREIWERREAAAEVTLTHGVFVNTDVSLPLDRVAPFLAAIGARVSALDPGARELVVSHLGDGNVHYTVLPQRTDADTLAAIMEAVEDLAVAMGGSFSAEHGIGKSKRAAMARHKDPVALSVMRSIKAALDPENRMNPGKVLPEA